MEVQREDTENRTARSPLNVNQIEIWINGKRVPKWYTELLFWVWYDQNITIVWWNKLNFGLGNDKTTTFHWIKWLYLVIGNIAEVLSEFTYK